MTAPLAPGHRVVGRLRCACERWERDVIQFPSLRTNLMTGMVAWEQDHLRRSPEPTHRAEVTFLFLAHNVLADDHREWTALEAKWRDHAARPE